MNLFPDLQKRYTQEQLSAPEAQRLAEFIAWGPMIFQVSRIMLKYGILDMLRNSDDGMTEEQIVSTLKGSEYELSQYAVKCLLEASLSIGTVLIDQDTDRYSLSKTGWFLLIDQATKVNINFNHDVNYEGMFRLEESLREGRPAGLEHFGTWPFYSDSSFAQALEIVFRQHNTKSLYDVGGNTGKWALQCVNFDKDVEVTVIDLPQQIQLMQANTAGKPGADRIKGHGINLLDQNAQFPQHDGELDAIWMSQFLDCFSMEQIVSILLRARKAMTSNTRLYIMETLWDRQKFETAALCLTMTSLYFTTMANGNSKMYHSQDMERCIKLAGLEIEEIHDGLGQGHSIIVCKNS